MPPLTPPFPIHNSSFSIHNLLFLFFILTSCTSTPSPTLPPHPTSTPPPTPTDIILPSPTPTDEPLAPPFLPFPQHIPYVANSLLPNHRTQAQLDEDVRTFYDDWKATYLLEAGQTSEGQSLYRVAFGRTPPNQNSTVSEGQGYGMVIVPLMAGHDPDAQVIFDGLWRFVRAHPSEKDNRLMDWKVPEPSGNDSAFDGDADIAYGLLLADRQWGSEGDINYKAEAETVIAGILKSTIGPTSLMPMLGDWANPYGDGFNQYTPRASDFMLANFRAYGRATGDPVWTEIIVRSQAVMVFIQTNFSPESGLLPDFIIMPGPDHTPEPSPAEFLESPHDGHYFYNAGRVPWRVGMDALLNGDATSRAIAQKISLWAEDTTGGDPTRFRAGYDLDGNPLPDSDYFSTFFVSPLGVAAMTQPDQQDWLNAIYDSVIGERQNYYEDSVTMLCLLVMTGNFWTP